jgi:hypothetical protein
VRRKASCARLLKHQPMLLGLTVCCNNRKSGRT